MTSLERTLTPTPEQLRWQHWGLGVFFHFGLNTFHGKEWSDGTLPAASFDPAELDARQWVAVAKEAGARYVVLTAKHHDGFCLWPTETTDYSVASSPWKDGRGDVVGDVAAACAEAGLGLGLYLSPWDRNAPCYDDPAAYDDFYVRQLTELCTRYGPLVELWFDGAGSQGRTYDWAAIMDVVHTHQPGAMVFNMGDPTIRWVGNEDGYSADPYSYVIDHTKMDNYTVVTTTFSEALYLPIECDVSLRRGWFWQPAEQPKDLDHLLAIYYRSIGLGANLLLNIPPDRRGLIDDADRARVAEWAAELDRRFADPIPAKLTETEDGVMIDFGAEVELDHLALIEELADGQRITGHTVFDQDQQLVAGQTVGSRRLHAFPARRVERLSIKLDGDAPRLAEVIGYATGVSEIPELPADYRATTTAPLD
ncbi:alpha-L-fucosidase [Microlunatus parietis]|uniref:alpha-L-fucosidase n=1 Tax=Microlunatus parietis TaxID=682979 RepID=A0A7Y9IFA1_9ACTN|nr:alpha-L-fucosidase [Microlunatus parietis]NYE75576.1 alpha-L-fucosidase [Microlunatus parietis]